ncbi:hypothetical protein HDC33_002584 [Sporosarcina sp. JAI121]|nr:hypothetical protein [Sporosarcina sp. JAI121]
MENVEKYRYFKDDDSFKGIINYYRNNKNRLNAVILFLH